MGAAQQALTMSGAAGGGSAPDQIAGMQLWIDATNPALLYQTSGGSLVSADGQTVDVAQDAGGLSRCMRQSTSGDRPTYKTNIVNGKSVLRFDGSTDFMVGNTTSAPGTAASSLACSDLVSASAGTYIVALNVASARSAQANAYQNDGIFADQIGDNLGLSVSLSGATITFYAYNHDGSRDQATVMGAQSTWHVVSMRHGGGNLEIRINGGSWVTVASGNTTQLTQPPFTGKGLTFSEPQWDLAHEAWWNVALSDGDVTAVEDYFAAQLGL